MGRKKVYADDAERQRACRERHRQRVEAACQVRESPEEIERRGRDLRLLLGLIDGAEAAGSIDSKTARRLVGYVHKIASK